MAQGNVEVWLGSLLKASLESFHGVIRQASVAIQDPSFELMEFENSFPAQVKDVCYFYSYVYYCCVLMSIYIYLFIYIYKYIIIHILLGWYSWYSDDMDKRCRGCFDSGSH